MNCKICDKDNNDKKEQKMNYQQVLDLLIEQYLKMYHEKDL